MSNLATGQRFNVFEVITDHPGCEIIPVGWQSIGVKDEILADAVLIYSKYNYPGCTFTMWPDDVKKVGTLVITKLK